MNDIETQIDNIAQKIVRYGLELPASLFLEIHLPLTSFLHTATLFATPFATPVFGAERINGLTSLLAERSNIEALITRIEFYSAKKTTP